MSASNHSSNLHQIAASTVLAAWGISPAIARQFCLHYDGRNAFSYPSAEGSRQRLLFINKPKSGAKNIWDKNTAHLPMPPLFNSATIDTDWVYLTNGEKSTLALHTAGITNVVNTFGEGNRIKDAIQVLLEKHIQRVWLAPDCDTPGLRAARRWYELGSAAGLDIQLFDLRLYLASEYQFTPEQYAKWDLRDLWLLVKQDPTAFQTALDAIPPLDFGRYAEEVTLPQAARTHLTPVHKKLRVNSLNIDWAAAHQSWVAEEVMPALDRVSPPPSRGKHRPCPNPHHHDNNPSFRISEQNIPQCTCGIQTEQKPWQQVAAWVGARSWADYKAEIIAQQPPKKRKKSKRLRPFIPAPQRLLTDKAQQVLNLKVDYLTQAAIQPSGVTLLKSPIGTGKTEWMAQQIKPGMKVLILGHRRALLDQQADRFSVGGNSFEYYESIHTDYLPMVNQLAITVNSLYKLLEQGQLRHYDALIIDESESVLKHLFGETFMRTEGKNAHLLMKHLLETTPLVICADADLSDLTLNWVAHYRQDIQLVINHSTRRRGKLDIVETRDMLIRQLVAQLKKAKKPIAIACDSKDEVKTLHELLSAEATGFAIHSENSDQREVIDFIKHINERLPKLDYLVYSPSLGTGVDIQVEVEAVYGLFNNRSITVDEQFQMLGRCRRADHFVVYTRDIERDLETDAQQLRHNVLLNNREFADRFDISLERKSDGSFSYRQDDLEFLDLWADCTAHTNRQLSQPRTLFILKAKANYEVTFIEDEDPEAYAEYHETRKALKEQEREMLLSSQPVSDKAYKQAQAIGEVDEEMRFGHQRWQLEDFYGQAISEELLDHSQKGGQAKLATFIDYYRSKATLLEGDTQEIKEGIPLQSRQLRAYKIEIIRTLLYLIFGRHLQSELISEANLLEKLETFNSLYDLLAVDRVFNRRGRKSEDPLARLRWVLGLLGLSLKTVYVGEDKHKFFQLDVDTYNRMVNLAEARNQHRADLISIPYLKDLPSSSIENKDGKSGSQPPKPSNPLPDMGDPPPEPF